MADGGKKGESPSKSDRELQCRSDEKKRTKKRVNNDDESRSRKIGFISRSLRKERESTLGTHRPIEIFRLFY
jgi:hypothetical protein